MSDRTDPGNDERLPAPRNLIRELSRTEAADPPNLHRFSTRQSLEDQGVMGMQDRFARGVITDAAGDPDGSQR
jgi:hypothetical protein